MMEHPLPKGIYSLRIYVNFPEYRQAIHGICTILNLLGRRTFKLSPSADKVIITVFWDCERVISMDKMGRGETVNSDAHIGTLTLTQEAPQRGSASQ
jgi:hypothetical protein